MLKIVICEDDIKQRERLKDMVNKQIVRKNLPAKVELATSEPTAVRSFLKEDLVNRGSDDTTAYLLDIDLNQQETGLVLAHDIRIEDPNAYIIFVTIMQKHMRDAFKYRAFDFIIKSFSIKMEKDVEAVIDRLMEDYTKWFIDTKRPVRLKFDSISRNISVSINEFVGIKKNGNSYSAYTTHGIYRYFKTLKTLMDQLEKHPNIVRCHESAIINLDHVVRIEKESKIIYSHNGAQFPMARRRMNEVMKRWKSLP